MTPRIRPVPFPVFPAFHRPLSLRAGVLLIGALLAFGSAQATSKAEQKTEPVVLVMLGDSLTAGFGLAPQEALPVRLEQALRAQGYAIEIRNAGLSGDTTAGGAERLAWSLDDDVDAVLVELGGNDLLRAIPPAETRRNLDAILSRLQARGVTILLAGMLALPNYGPEYGAEFNAIYPDLARRYDVPLYPFILDGVADHPELLQEDGIHPNAAGVEVIARRLAPFITAALFTERPADQGR